MVKKYRTITGQGKKFWPVIKNTLGNVYSTFAAALACIFVVGFVSPSLINSDTFSMYFGVLLDFVMVSVAGLALVLWISTLISNEDD